MHLIQIGRMGYSRWGEEPSFMEALKTGQVRWRHLILFSVPQCTGICPEVYRVYLSRYIRERTCTVVWVYCILQTFSGMWLRLAEIAIFCFVCELGNLGISECRG